VPYTTCNVICGCGISGDLREYIEDLGIKPEEIGFERGFRDTQDIRIPYCGVFIFEFNESSRVIPCSFLIAKFTATKNQLSEARKRLDNARKKISQILDRDQVLGEKRRNDILSDIPKEPETLLFWSTS